MDGVLYDFEGDVRHWVASSTGRDVKELAQTGAWMLYEAWGLAQDEFEATVAAGIRAGVIFRAGSVAQEALDALSGLMGAGYNVHIVTSRGDEHVGQSFGVPELCRMATLDWLDEQKVPYTSLTFAGDKTTVATGFFLEDNVTDYELLRADGSFAVLMDRPWNRDVTTRDGLIVRDRVRTVQEFADRVVWGVR